MAQSPEYPDLKWVTPKAWTNANRSSVQLIVIHTTEGSEGPQSAEDGAAYDARRTDGTSTHYFHDANSTVQCVNTADQAHAARSQGNRRGIQHELCGRAGQGTPGWADADSQGTLRQAAKQCARDAKKWGISVRHLTVAQVADGVKGFCGHADITKAFPQDNGTHTDPGPSFPWSQFLDLVRDFMDDGQLEDDMADLTDADKKWLKDNIWSARLTDEAGNARTLGKSVNASVDLLLDMQAAVAQLVGAAGLEAAETPDVIAAAVVAKLGAGATPQAKADLLRAALGADAAEVGRLLAA